MLLFHGTTLENALDIQKNGFKYESCVWNCSLNETYFFTEDFFLNEFEHDTFSELWNYAIQETMDQARITMACHNPQNYRGAVLVFDTELMSNGDQIRPDDSCENMSDCAVALTNPDMNGLVAIIAMDSDERESRIFWLASMKDRDYFEMPSLDYLTSSMLDAIDLNNSYDIFEALKENPVETLWISTQLKSKLEEVEESTSSSIVNYYIFYPTKQDYIFLETLQ